MEKALTFKRKVYEVEAIQFKGEENVQAVLDFFEKYDAEAESRMINFGTFEGRALRPSKLGVDFKFKDDREWNILFPENWIVIDPFERDGYRVFENTNVFTTWFEGI